MTTAPCCDEFGAAAPAPKPPTKAAEKLRRDKRVEAKLQADLKVYDSAIGLVLRAYGFGASGADDALGVAKIRETSERAKKKDPAAARVLSFLPIVKKEIALANAAASPNPNTRAKAEHDVRVLKCLAGRGDANAEIALTILRLTLLHLSFLQKGLGLSDKGYAHKPYDVLVTLYLLARGAGGTSLVAFARKKLAETAARAKKGDVNARKNAALLATITKIDKLAMALHEPKTNASAAKVAAKVAAAAQQNVPQAIDEREVLRRLLLARGYRRAGYVLSQNGRWSKRGTTSTFGIDLDEPTDFEVGALEAVRTVLSRGAGVANAARSGDPLRMASAAGSFVPGVAGRAIGAGASAARSLSSGSALGAAGAVGQFALEESNLPPEVKKAASIGISAATKLSGGNWIGAIGSVAELLPGDAGKYVSAGIDVAGQLATGNYVGAAVTGVLAVFNAIGLHEPHVESVLQGLAMGAGIGGLVGTIIPGIGNVVGAVAGAIVGAIVGLFSALFGESEEHKRLKIEARTKLFGDAVDLFQKKLTKKLEDVERGKMVWLVKGWNPKLAIESLTKTKSVLLTASATGNPGPHNLNDLATGKSGDNLEACMFGAQLVINATGKTESLDNVVKMAKHLREQVTKIDEAIATINRSTNMLRGDALHLFCLRAWVADLDKQSTLFPELKKTTLGLACEAMAQAEDLRARLTRAALDLEKQKKTTAKNAASAKVAAKKAAQAAKAIAFARVTLKKAPSIKRTIARQYAVASKRIATRGAIRSGALRGGLGIAPSMTSQWFEGELDRSLAMPALSPLVAQIEADGVDLDKTLDERAVVAVEKTFAVVAEDTTNDFTGDGELLALVEAVPRPSADEILGGVAEESLAAAAELLESLEERVAALEGAQEAGAAESVDEEAEIEEALSEEADESGDE